MALKEEQPSAFHDERAIAKGIIGATQLFQGELFTWTKASDTLCVKRLGYGRSIVGVLVWSTNRPRFWSQRIRGSRSLRCGGLVFLHEKDAMVGVYSFIIAGGSALGGIFAGLVANATPNWRWVFGTNTILTGINFLFIVLFQAETNFERPYEYEHSEGLQCSDIAVIKTQVTFSWVESLSVTSWLDQNTSLWKLAIKPFRMLRYPAVLWCIAVYGVTLGWFMLQQTANAAAFPELASWGAVIGCFAGGPLSDYIAAHIAKKYGGQYRPEYRLWCLVPMVAFGPVGLLPWGAGLGKHLPPMVAIAGSGISYAVLCATPAVGMTYVVDCYRPVSSEVMTILTVSKNALAFGLSFGVVLWLVKYGFLKVGWLCTLIESIVFLTTIPMYYYGESLRTRI
ncbi:hypothetical protein BDV26DRAFT_289218 [Aspergillus bertholletiae]|uniref:Major facilitator superfamily domain-containing protein n=1 Tax=Aspergillus bertholletiae TaxID=1226010 RepID=A0A5N7BIZ6_9EURO|nr:hypothetical protein BDV26DRAFT_289218 [Aspergillus bertholletiae]